MAGVDVGTAYLTVVPSAKGFAGKLQSELGGGMSAAGKKAGADASTAFGGSFRSGISNAAKAGALVLAGIAAGGVAFVKDSISEARESQKVGAMTENVIRSTGSAAKVTAAQVGDLASAISSKTGIDDEAVQSGANMLLTFKNIRNEAGKGNDIFNQSTAVLTDMATAMGSDPKNAAIQLGKALNDPVAGISALSRVGVTFTDQQKKTIKSLVDGGKTAEAQKVILAELNSEFGGAAAASSTMGEKAATAFGNLKEQIGTALLPVIDKISGFLMEKAIPAVSDFFKGLQDGSGAGGKVRDVVLKIVDAVKGFVTEFQNGTDAGGRFRDILTQVGAVIQNVSKWVGDNQTLVKSLVVAVMGGVVAFQVITGVVKAYTAVQTLLNIVMAANPIGIVIIAIAALAAGLIYAYTQSETFRSYVSTAFSIVKIGALTLAKVAISAFQGLANMWMTAVGTLLNGAATAFGWVPGLGPKLQGAATEFGKFKDSANAKLNAIKNSIDVNIRTEQANLALEALHREFINKGWTVTATANVNMVYAGGGKVVPRATGGPVAAGGAYAVGDNPDGSWNRTTELFVPKTAGNIYTQKQLGSMGGGGGLSQHDINRIAVALSQVQVQATVSAGSFDRAMGARRW